MSTLPVGKEAECATSSYCGPVSPLDSGLSSTAFTNGPSGVHDSRRHSRERPARPGAQPDDHRRRAGRRQVTSVTLSLRGRSDQRGPRPPERSGPLGLPNTRRSYSHPLAQHTEAHGLGNLAHDPSDPVSDSRPRGTRLAYRESAVCFAKVSYLALANNSRRWLHEVRLDRTSRSAPAPIAERADVPLVKAARRQRTAPRGAPSVALASGSSSKGSFPMRRLSTLRSQTPC